MKSDNTRMVRTINLLMWMADRPVSPREIQNRYGVSRKSAYNYINAFSDAGLVIEKSTPDENFGLTNNKEVYFQIVSVGDNFIFRKDLAQKNEEYRSNQEYVRAWLKEYTRGEEKHEQGLVSLSKLSRMAGVSYFSVHAFREGRVKRINGLDKLHDEIMKIKNS
jgi:hypothetical protein